jgi:hydroxymethylpyrimidine/phosphomethylpyrimidine kinase
VHGRVLAIAGSDSSGGAGIQADIKTITALDAYVTCALTAVTVQDTHGVKATHALPPALVVAQVACVLADIGADAVKCGMLGSAAIIEAVAGVLQDKARGVPLVLDPVMQAKGGAALLDAGAMPHLLRHLLPHAALITPNVPEAEALSGMAIADADAMARAAEALLRLGVAAVLLKGGHLPGPQVVDLLATEEGMVHFRAPRAATRHTHGTGCTLASAVAAGLAQGMALSDAVARAHAYVQAAIRSAPGLGGGHGPLNHAVTVDPTRLAALLRRPGALPLDPAKGREAL